MSTKLSISAHTSALALVLLALSGAVGETRDAHPSGSAQSAPFAVSVLVD